MYSKSSILIFTDLDGTLLNRDTFKFDSIKVFLNKLKNKNIIIIPNSSKTEDEIIEFNKEANFKFPFISENGSIIHNLNFLSGELPDKIILAKKVHEIQNIFDKNINQDLKSKCKVISNLTLQEQIQIFGLPENKLKQVFKRTCTIPIKFEGNNKEKLLLKNILLEIGLDFKDGGRVLNLGDRINKADAMKKIIFILKNKFKSKPKTIAVGDNHNDIEMLKISDIPCLVKNDKFINKDLQIKNLIISKQTAPEGWVEIVKLALEKIK
jgi:HAD-superfamily hydrolase, subfamily IIB